MSISNLQFEISDRVKALLPEEKLAKLAAQYAQLDANQDGKIEMDEFLNFVLTRERERFAKKFQAADSNNDGSVEFEEFVAAVEPNFHILKRFHELDRDQNGLLSIEEALNVADRLVLPLNSTQIETIFRDVDRDRDGHLTYYEFLGAVAHIGFQ